MERADYLLQGDQFLPTEEDRAVARAGRADAPAPPTGGRAERRRAAKRAKTRRRLRATREVPILVVTALLIALLLKTFLLQAFSIPSGSMENTIRIGDRVVVDKLTPWFGSTPRRGDVVVFKDPGHWLDGQPPAKQDPPGVKQVKSFFTFIGLLPSANEQDLIKRVIGVGGDTVQCCDKNGKVTVNGQPLDEPYLHPGNEPSKIKFKVNVPRGRIFVMGDHRANSADSRFHLDDGKNGTVPVDLVVGRAFVIAWPTGHWRRLEEPETYASVPDRARTATALGSTAITKNPPETRVPPVPPELPLVMTVVGLLPGRAVALRPRVRRRTRDDTHGDDTHGRDREE
ncbi:signal peptidase I [Wenjunlia tyrosinilytica]|uniref:signal peptidase I n=1 Tax=Wenjunlia tyrosinilytica TaxID=1544741 RepID=UPI001E45F424|nr:signal peptidase I [Wenjunlia tyrosinilytica]